MYRYIRNIYIYIYLYTQTCLKKETAVWLCTFWGGWMRNRVYVWWLCLVLCSVILRHTEEYNASASTSDGHVLSFTNGCLTPFPRLQGMSYTQLCNLAAWSTYWTFNNHQDLEMGEVCTRLLRTSTSVSNINWKPSSWQQMPRTLAPPVSWA